VIVMSMFARLAARDGCEKKKGARVRGASRVLETKTCKRRRVLSRSGVGGDVVVEDIVEDVVVCSFVRSFVSKKKSSHLATVETY